MNKATRRGSHRLPSVTYIGGASRHWGVYETAYPEEGCIPYVAQSEAEAIGLHRRATGDKVTHFSAAEMTEAQARVLEKK